MSHVIRIVLHCDRRGCGEEYASDARAVGQARRWAESAGWAVKVQSLADARYWEDFCPVHKTAPGGQAVAA